MENARKKYLAQNVIQKQQFEPRRQIRVDPILTQKLVVFNMIPLLPQA